MALNAKMPAPAGKGGRQAQPKASSNPSKAESRTNLKTTFGTPKKQK